MSNSEETKCGHAHVEHAIRLETLVDDRALRTIKTLGAELSKDGDMWCWLYGENVQVGVAGFGKSPMLAAYDFEYQFHKVEK